MRPVLCLSRALRLFILCLLIPAYGIAAAGVSSYAGGVASAERLQIEGHGLERVALLCGATAAIDDGSSTDADDSSALMAEHGDTSDDMSDHCLPHAFMAMPGFAPVAVPAAAPTRAPDAPPGRLQRPPRD